jgi:hypothetical protein
MELQGYVPTVRTKPLLILNYLDKTVEGSRYYC